MTHYTAIPVNKANIEKFGADFTKPGNLVSNGAYKLTEYVANDHITAVKNPDYWDAANVKIDKVIYNPSEDQAAVARAFEAGEIDIAYNFQADQRDFLTKKLGEDQVQASPALATYYYAFDSRHAPFDDVRVRKALSIAVDRDFLSEKVYGGTQLPSYTFVPPGMEGYTSPKPADADKDQLDREDEAKALLKEAGYGEGGKPLKIDIRYNTNENHKKVAVAVADMWKAIGAEVTIQNLDVKSHYAYLQEGGTFDVARAGWSADYADPENFLNLLVSTNKAFNYGHYSNPKYDELMKASYAETDPAKRMAILAEAEAIVLNEYPVTPFMNNANLWLGQPQGEGLQPECRQRASDQVSLHRVIVSGCCARVSPERDARAASVHAAGRDAAPSVLKRFPNRKADAPQCAGHPERGSGPCYVSFYRAFCPRRRRSSSS